MTSSERHAGAFALIVCATTLGLAGIDLILPAIPSLPGILGGTAEEAQFVLASFVAGTAAGLLLFGTLGNRWPQRALLVWSLIVYALVSILCVFSPSLGIMTGLRFLQGAAGAAPAVFAPGMLRSLYGDEKVVAAFGVIGSIEALVPALAPIAGFALLHAFGWQSSFLLIGALSTMVAIAIALAGGKLPVPPPRAVEAGKGSYLRVLRIRRFLGLSASHALTLGGLLVIVFAAPTIFTQSMGGTINDFIHMQMGGVAMFMVTANLAGRYGARIGTERMILWGTVASCVGASLLLAYALAGGQSILIVNCIYLIVNGGLGVRGPGGFHAAVVAADGDDARGSALIVVMILSVSAIGTAAVAPFIDTGLIAMALGAAVCTWGAVLALLAGGPAPKVQALAA